jgi:hypothetical protein
MKAEANIVGADGNGIRQRWLYGLRILRDPQVIAPSGKSLRHGAADKLVTAAEARGLQLSELEIRRRVQCARAYPHESQIDQALIDFKTWYDLMMAGFPPYEAEPDEPPADPRTTEERNRARGQLLLLEVGEQGRLFPLNEFEPSEATLKDLIDYADEQDRITEAFAERGRKRRDYIETLMEAVNDDVSQTWLDAHKAAYGNEPGDETTDGQ